MADSPMTPEEYARFMSGGMEETGTQEAKANKGLDSSDIDRIRMILKQTGVTSDNIMRVMDKIATLKLGELREFNFVRGHVRRVRIRRELSGKVTVITY